MESECGTDWESHARGCVNQWAAKPHPTVGNLEYGGRLAATGEFFFSLFPFPPLSVDSSAIVFVAHSLRSGSFFSVSLDPARWPGAGPDYQAITAWISA
jgi:hypothetical protein